MGPEESPEELVLSALEPQHARRAAGRDTPCGVEGRARDEGEPGRGGVWAGTVERQSAPTAQHALKMRSSVHAVLKRHRRATRCRQTAARQKHSDGADLHLPESYG